MPSLFLRAGHGLCPFSARRSRPMETTAAGKAGTPPDATSTMVFRSLTNARIHSPQRERFRLVTFAASFALTTAALPG